MTLTDHRLRRIDALLGLSKMRRYLTGLYGMTRRPSLDLELMIWKPIVGYRFGIRSERRSCEGIHLNLAYCWFCRLGLEGAVSDHPTSSKDRHGRFRESDAFRVLFEDVSAAMNSGLWPL